MKVLVVDDSRAMRMIVTRALRQAGFGQHEVIEAVDGADALRQVAAEAPGLVLSDWHMPRMDGFKLLSILRARGDDVPFGFITAHATPQRREMAERAGALFCVDKPVTADELGELVAPCLQDGSVRA